MTFMENITTFCLKTKSFHLYWAFSHISHNWIVGIKGQIRRSRYGYLFYIKIGTMAPRGKVTSRKSYNKSLKF